MRRLRFAVLFTLALGLFASTQGSARPVAALASSLDRATADRPDDVSGPQVHFLYVLPADGVDRAFDTGGQVAAMVGAAQRWLFSKTGLSLKLDKYQGQLDVSFLRLQESGSSLAALGPRIADRIGEEIHGAGFGAGPDSKKYVAMYDGPSQGCGYANWPPVVPGNIAIVSVLAACGPDTDYSVRAILHEVFHTFGEVPMSAPHQSGNGHVTDDPNDLMWGGSYVAPLESTVIDADHADYWNDLQAQANGGFLERNAYANLKVKVTGDGSIVSGSGFGGSVDCADSCSYVVERGQLMLTAQPNTGSRFVGWSGACSGQGACTLTVNGDQAVSAAFAPSLPKSWALQVLIRGRGMVNGAPGGPCSKSCVRMIPEGKKVTLTAVPAGGWKFVKWTGCPSRCSLALVRRKIVTATFVKKK